MAIFAFHPTPSNRRADGIGFVLAEGADEASARASAASLIGAPSLSGWAGVSIGAGLAPVAVEGLPVGALGNPTWPDRTRGNRALNS
jgi:hypothetical protein